MIRWFAAAGPFTTVCMSTPRAPVPVGVACGWCGELVAASDCGMYFSGGAVPFHWECFVRPIVGSVAHQRGECSCFGGDDCDDPSLSKRAAAFAAFMEFRERAGRAAAAGGGRRGGTVH